MQKLVKVDLQDESLVLKVEISEEGKGHLKIDAGIELIDVLEALAKKTPKTWDDQAVAALKTLAALVDKKD